MADIVVFGSLNMDLVVTVNQMPAPGQTVPGGDLQTICGGQGANQAVAAARLGLQVSMAGRVGGDAFGARLLDSLLQSGVDISGVRVDNNTVTGTAVILVDDQGENCIVISPGANGRVGNEDVALLQTAIAGARVILLQLEIPMAAVDRAVELAVNHNTCVILNPAPARYVSQKMLARVDFLVPNEKEAQQLTGMEVSDISSAEAAARCLLESGVKTVVITLGERGALLATREGCMHIPAPKVDAVDTTAAGDAFIAGLAAALVRGFPAQDAVRYANCCGSLAVTRFGAQTSLPTFQEVENIYRSFENPKHHLEE